MKWHAKFSHKGVDSYGVTYGPSSRVKKATAETAEHNEAYFTKAFTSAKGKPP